LLEKRVGSVQGESGIYETEAWGKMDQPSFLNAVILLDTQLAPEPLLFEILKIEEDLGRVRFEKWGERIIDIDILYYNSEVIELHNLVVPHPQLENRRFTLEPLVEVSPEFVHPVLQLTNRKLLEKCKDPLRAIRR